MRRAIYVWLLAVVCVGVTAAQTAGRKLPAPDKIINDYHRAAGGKKRLATVRDTTLTYAAADNGAQAAVTMFIKRPASLKTRIVNSNTPQEIAANTSSAWTRNGELDLRTLTDSHARNAKLQAALEATRFVDYRKNKILARTVGTENVSGTNCYVVEFSTREGGRVRYLFDLQTKLPHRFTDETRGITIDFSDYRFADGIAQPHRLSFSNGDLKLTADLQTATYNTGLDDKIFQPPVTEAIDVAALLRDLTRNQEEIEKRVSEYTYLLKQTRREINDKGELVNQEVDVYEVYPVVGGRPVQKKISENGVVLTGERLEKEGKRAGRELEEAERNQAKREEKSQREKDKNKAKEQQESEADLSSFLRACEFVSPRREMFRDRETIVFDFRPRPAYRPRTSFESIVSKLAGVMWVDPQDKQIMRLETRLVDNYKIGGGLLANIQSGTSFAFEQARLSDGVWLPRYADINISVKAFLLKTIKANFTNEYSDYKRFTTASEKEVLETPTNNQQQP